MPLQHWPWPGLPPQAAQLSICAPYFLDPTPVESTVYTGSGAVVISPAITGSRAYPNAGQPPLPDAGGFIAP